MGETEKRDEKVPFTRKEKIMYVTAVAVFLVLIIGVTGFFVAELILGPRGDQIRGECTKLTGFTV